VRGSGKGKQASKGKRGKRQITSAVYVLAKGEIGGITRIIANNKVLYDVRPGRSRDLITGMAGSWGVDLGDQVVPNPAYTTIHGANALTNKGWSCIWFKDLNVTDSGGDLPQFEVEVLKYPSSVSPEVSIPGSHTVTFVRSFTVTQCQTGISYQLDIPYDKCTGVSIIPASIQVPNIAGDVMFDNAGKLVWHDENDAQFDFPPPYDVARTDFGFWYDHGKEVSPGVFEYARSVGLEPVITFTEFLGGSGNILVALTAQYPAPRGAQKAAVPSISQLWAEPLTLRDAFGSLVHDYPEILNTWGRSINLEHRLSGIQVVGPESLLDRPFLQALLASGEVLLLTSGFQTILMSPYTGQSRIVGDLSALPVNVSDMIGAGSSVIIFTGTDAPRETYSYTPSTNALALVSSAIPALVNTVIQLNNGNLLGYVLQDPTTQPGLFSPSGAYLGLANWPIGVADGWSNYIPLADGRVFAAANQESGDVLYDPATDTFATIFSPIFVTRVVQISNGNILGITTGGEVVLYDLTSLTWSSSIIPSPAVVDLAVCNDGFVIGAVADPDLNGLAQLVVFNPDRLLQVSGSGTSSATTLTHPANYLTSIPESNRGFSEGTITPKVFLKLADGAISIAKNYLNERQASTVHILRGSYIPEFYGWALEEGSSIYDSFTRLVNFLGWDLVENFGQYQIVAPGNRSIHTIPAGFISRPYNDSSGLEEPIYTKRIEPAMEKPDEVRVQFRDIGRDFEISSAIYRGPVGGSQVSRPTTISAPIVMAYSIAVTQARVLYKRAIARTAQYTFHCNGLALGRLRVGHFARVFLPTGPSSFNGIPNEDVEIGWRNLLVTSVEIDERGLLKVSAAQLGDNLGLAPTPPTVTPPLIAVADDDLPDASSALASSTFIPTYDGTTGLSSRYWATSTPPKLDSILADITETSSSNISTTVTALVEDIVSFVLDNPNHVIGTLDRVSTLTISGTIDDGYSSFTETELLEGQGLLIRVNRELMRVATVAWDGTTWQASGPILRNIAGTVPGGNYVEENSTSMVMSNVVTYASESTATRTLVCYSTLQSPSTSPAIPFTQSLLAATPYRPQPLSIHIQSPAESLISWAGHGLGNKRAVGGRSPNNLSSQSYLVTYGITTITTSVTELLVPRTGPVTIRQLGEYGTQSLPLTMVP
jgi:hypothetical protein